MSYALAGTRAALEPAFVRDPLYIRAGQVPSVDWRFAQDRSLVDRIRGLPLTFTRTTGRTFEQADGTLGSVGVDTPAFSFSSGVPRGLDIWEARTNLMVRSEEFDNASWSKAATTVTANSAVSPSGASTADKLIEDSATSEHYARQTSPAYTAGATTTMSVYVKTAERTSIRLRSLDAAAPANGFFGSVDTSNGTTAGSSAGTGTLTLVTATSVGNGWWRLVVVGIASATATSSIFDIFLLSGNASSASSYTGNGTSGLYVWGAQLEAASNASPYIATAGSTVQRTADLCSTTDMSWYNASGGVFYVEARAATPYGGVNLFPRIYCLSNGTSNEMVEGTFRVLSSYTDTEYVITSGGVAQANFATNTEHNGRLQAQRFALNDFMFAVGGTIVNTDTSGTMPTGLNILNVGTRVGNGNALNGTISRLAYFPPGAAANNLQRMTA
jgi:hypothetical protein